MPVIVRPVQLPGEAVSIARGTRNELPTLKPGQPVRVDTGHGWRLFTIARVHYGQLILEEHPAP